jgi:hypothetical protein
MIDPIFPHKSAVLRYFGLLLIAGCASVQNTPQQDRVWNAYRVCRTETGANAVISALILTAATTPTLGPRGLVTRTGRSARLPGGEDHPMGRDVWSLRSSQRTVSAAGWTGEPRLTLARKTTADQN